MEDIVYLCASHVHECATLCDKAQKGLNEDIESITSLLRYEGVASLRDATKKCKPSSTIKIRLHLMPLYSVEFSCGRSGHYCLAAALSTLLSAAQHSSAEF